MRIRPASIVRALALIPVICAAPKSPASLPAAPPNHPAARGWSTKGPYGGEVFCLAGSPSGTIYAGTEQGAFVSRDWGQSWTLRSGGLAGLSVEDIALDSAGNAFAATSEGLFRKASDSLIWKPTGPSDFYLSVATDNSGGVFAGSYHHGLLVSLDHGQTWLDRPPSRPAPSVYRLVVDGAGTVFAGTQSGVYLSRDAGVSWTLRELAPGEVVTALGSSWNSRDAAAPPAYTLLAGTSRGRVYLSHDGGETWSSVTASSLTSPVTAVISRPDGSIFAGSQEGFWQLDRLTNTWVRDGAGYNGGHVNGALMIGDRLYLATAAGVEYRAGDRWLGENQGLWAHSVKAVAAGPDGLVIAATRDGLYRSVDSGLTWEYAGEPEAQVSSITISSGGAIYVSLLGNSHPTGILRSSDSGLSWHTAGDGLPAGSVFSIAIDKQGRVYAGAQSGLFVSDDGGNVWRESDWGMGPEAIHSVIDGADGDIYAASRDGIFRSTDRGVGWTPVNTGLLSAHAEFVAAGADGAVYAGSGPRIYRSSNHGANWELRSAAPDGVGPVELAVARDGAVYLSDLQSGVWMSQDGGAHWRSITVGLYTPYVLSLALAPDGQLYAGTSGSSVWQLRAEPPPSIALRP